MNKKLFITIIVLLTMGAGFAFSQSNQNIPYVDIPKAEAEIEELTKANKEMQTQNKELQAEIVTEEDLIEDTQKTINEIEFILERVKAKGSDLYEIYSDIVDAETKVKAKETIDKNRDLRNQLESKKKENQAVIEESQKIIESNKKQININSNKISRNIDRVNMLNASIEKTRTQTQVLNSYIDSVDEINKEAEAVLKQ